MLSKEAYWALGRPRALQDAAIDASANFGMFDSMTGRQVAYARVVTDSVTIAWLCAVSADNASWPVNVCVKSTNRDKSAGKQSSR